MDDRQRRLLVSAVVVVAAALLVATVLALSGDSDGVDVTADSSNGEGQPGPGEDTETTVSAPPASVGSGEPGSAESATSQAPPRPGATDGATTNTTNPPPAGQSGVKGVVVAGPTCPVEGTEEDCGDRPVQATVQVRNRSSGTNAATVQTTGDGRFQIPLPPGDYVVRAETSQAEYCDAVDVTVASGRYADVRVRCDTGIR